MKNLYGYEVKETCDYCQHPVSSCREIPWPCSKCKKTACGICTIEQWDGEEGFTCEKCKKEDSRIARGDWTAEELEEAGQLKLV